MQDYSFKDLEELVYKFIDQYFKELDYDLMQTVFKYLQTKDNIFDQKVLFTLMERLQASLILEQDNFIDKIEDF